MLAQPITRTSVKIAIASLALAVATLLAGCANEAASVPAPAPVSTTQAAPASAVLTAATRDDAFVAALDDNGIHYSSRAAAVAAGRKIAQLHQDGYTALEIYRGFVDVGTSFTHGEVALIVAAAVTAYES